MGAPQSPIDICNMALAHLGEPPIDTISPPVTEREDIVALQYDDARQNVLRKNVWNFAKKRVLASRSGTPTFDYADEYALPSDFIRLLSVNGLSATTGSGEAGGEISQTLDYDIEGRSVLLNASGAPTVQMRYIADIETVSTWDPLFRKLVILTLALQLAYTITGKKEMVEQMNALLTRELPDAASIDGQEVPPKRIQRSRALTARRSPGIGASTAGVASPYTYLP